MQQTGTRSSLGMGCRRTGTGHDRTVFARRMYCGKVGVMNDLEISKALALAIGWRKDQLSPSDNNPNMKQCWVWFWYKWKVFDYRDPAVIWPIAVKYDMFPSRARSGVWSSDMWYTEAETPEKAVALAVIRRAAK